MQSLFGKTLEELEQIISDLKQPRFVAKQLAQWLYEKRATEFAEMTNLSLKLRTSLQDNYTIGRYAPIKYAQSTDGTKKYLFKVAENQFVETVYLPENDRHTLCISTQAGCKMGCAFCMTGTLGFHGNLSAGEILNQIYSIPESKLITNIVVMGEGEPCDNIDNVLTALKILTSGYALAWSPKRITVSSVGYVPGLRRLLEETDCHIAISLHNPIARERAEIMPIEKRYPIEQVVQLLRQYDFAHQRRLSFEYICFHGQNDTIRYANALRKLLNGLPARVNLIKFHQQEKTSDNNSQNATTLCSSDEGQMLWLRDYLSDSGITCTIRRSRGEDILAACGMLVNALTGHPNEGKNLKNDNNKIK